MCRSRIPTARDALLPRQVRRLAAGYRELFGEDLPPIDCAWGGSFASTRDGLPFIGRVPGMHPGLQFALCYGGNGITFSVHAADMIRAGVEGRAHELDDVFGFAREGGRPTKSIDGAEIPAASQTLPHGRSRLSRMFVSDTGRLPDSGRVCVVCFQRDPAASKTYYNVAINAARAEVEPMAEPRNPAHVLGVGSEIQTVKGPVFAAYFAASARPLRRRT